MRRTLSSAPPLHNRIHRGILRACFAILLLIPAFMSLMPECAGPTFSVYAQLEEDTLTIDDPLARQAEEAAAADTSKPDTITVLTPEGRKHKIVRRDFDPRQQVVIGTSIMAFVVLVLTMSANWNPE